MKKFELSFILNLEGEWHIQDYIKDIIKNRQSYSKRIEGITGYEKANLVSRIKALLNLC